jgi:hypothetical protein
MTEPAPKPGRKPRRRAATLEEVAGANLSRASRLYHSSCSNGFEQDRDAVHMFLRPLYDFTDNVFSLEDVDIFIRLLASSNSRKVHVLNFS